MLHRRGIAPTLLLCCIWSGALTLSKSAIAQNATNLPAGEELTALLQRMHANLVANAKLARQYACDDSMHSVALNKKGKKIRDDTEKFESAVINGVWYNRQVEKNGVPLSARKMASTQKHLDAIHEIGRGKDFIFDVRDINPRDSVYSSLPFCCLATLFENRALRYEQINGRDNLVVESTPKANPETVSEDEITALDWKETTWIDMADLIPTRYEAELLNDRSFVLKGTTERRDFFRFEWPPDSTSQPKETVWLESHMLGHLNIKFAWQLEFQTSEGTSYNYKKFKTDMRLLPDSVQEISSQGASQKP